MGVKLICDGCGKKRAGGFEKWGIVLKPDGKWSGWFSNIDCSWYQQTNKTQFACSRECIDLISEKTGKTDVVLPKG